VAELINTDAPAELYGGVIGVTPACGIAYGFRRVLLIQTSHSGKGFPCNEHFTRYRLPFQQ